LDERQASTSAQDRTHVARAVGSRPAQRTGL
jgi:hypothetical protein